MLTVREFKGGYAVFDGEELITRTPTRDVAEAFARGQAPAAKAMDAAARKAVLAGVDQASGDVTEDAAS